MNSQDSRFENRLFLALLALLVWLPLPLGSNRPWAEALFEIGVAVLSLLWLWGFQRDRVTVGAAFKGARAVLWLLAGWLVYVALQLVPLPALLHEALSPESAAMYRLAGDTDWAPLSLHPYASFLFWLKSVAYVLLFALTLLLVSNKQRLAVELVDEVASDKNMPVRCRALSAKLFSPEAAVRQIVAALEG